MTSVHTDRKEKRNVYWNFFGYKWRQKKREREQFLWHYYSSFLANKIKKGQLMSPCFLPTQLEKLMVMFTQKNDFMLDRLLGENSQSYLNILFSALLKNLHIN